MECILVGIDRDGTLIKDSGGFPGKNWPNEKFELMQEANIGLRILRNMPNTKLVMITNQSGPARRKVKEEHIAAINRHIQGMLSVALDGVYVCMHVPLDYARKHNIQEPEFSRYVENCNCRKPKTKLLEDAANDLFGRRLPECRVYMIGDRVSDIQTGIVAGGKGVFIPSSDEEHSDLEEAYCLQKQEKNRVLIANDFLDAALKIYRDVKS